MGLCVLAGDKGGKRGCPDFSGDCLQRGAGDRGARVFAPNERGGHGEHGRGSGVCGYCTSQCSTVSTVAGAGEVFVGMAARVKLWRF